MTQLEGKPTTDGVYSQKSKTNNSLREQSTVSNIQSQDLLQPLNPESSLKLNQNSEIDSAAGLHDQCNTTGVVNLEVDSNTDLPQEYFQFIQQENQTMKEEIDEITDQFKADAAEHRRQKDDWQNEIDELERELA